MILKMGLGVGEMRLIFCCKQLLRITRIQASDPGLKGSLNPLIVHSVCSNDKI